MPRVALTQQQKLNSNIKQLSKKCECLLTEYHIKRKEVAELVGISEPAISKQFKERNISIATYMAVTMLVEERKEE